MVGSYPYQGLRFSDAHDKRKGNPHNKNEHYLQPEERVLLTFFEELVHFVM
mgnify:FL=1